MPEIDSWAARVTRSVAWQVHRHRKALGWSAQKLSDACAELGMEFPRSTLADLETGRRAHVSVAELLILARALDVPPLLLLFPVGTEEETEVLPGEARPVFRAAQWFAGEGPFPGLDDAGVVTVTGPHNSGTARALALYRAHDRAFQDQVQAMRAANSLGEQAADADPAMAEHFAVVVDGLRDKAEGYRAAGEHLREEAVALGIRPPDPAVMLLRPEADSATGEQGSAEGKSS